MRAKVVRWLDREFVALSCEAREAGEPRAQAREVFGRFQDELQRHGLSLDNVVRTRLWARDSDARNDASKERTVFLGGGARSASSSFVAPDHFDSTASVGMDLLALRPRSGGLEKTIQEYDPPIVPVRFVVYDSLVFCSGVTSTEPTLADQIANVAPRILDSLSLAGSSWDRVERVSCYLHRSQSPSDLEALLRKAFRAELPGFEYAFVDGYSTEGKLLETEVTARR